MAEMLPLIQIAPESNLTHDPSTGIIGAALGRDVVIVSMDGVNEQLGVLEVAVEDLYTALDPTTVSEGSYPGREGVYLTAGKLTNMVYGFVLGLVLLLALLL
ncbi:tetrahydromethanopterin S-methyltransferase subunit B [Methanobacterium sp. CWC-01]|jgi:tetrahydromethanopterin S-methyltransferase subunit B|uniref:tetrahydromethanopterin S-methyltransferase subunit MtrB n=1 Tax=Methanobacterium aridiramus TaxID=2584467 RepID=UPI002578B7C3|nr:tetrahydromethanopterin S-methyltransferase subunit B [Methanobacterium sp. CWC-01]WJI09764.1 tetrahydromethanopterin S-methyltransferase subunit B [Methanobacterium sp. CWC-01]